MGFDPYETTTLNVEELIVKKSLLISAVAIATLPFLIAAGQESHTLRLKLQPGQVITIKNTTSSTVSMAAMGQDNVSTVKTTQTISIDKGSEAGWNKATIKTTEFEMDGGGDVTMQAISPEQMKEEILKQVITGEFNELGKIRNYKIENKTTMPGAIEASMQEAGIMGFHYPEQPMTVGSEWKQEANLGKMIMESAGEFIANASGNLTSTYKVSEFTKLNGIAVAKVEVSMTGKATFDVPQMGSGGASDVKGTGTLYISLDNGLPIESTITTSSNTDVAGVLITQSAKVVSKVSIK